MDFHSCLDRFGRFSWSRTGSKYLEVKLKVLKKVDKRDFHLIQNLTMGEPDLSSSSAWGVSSAVTYDLQGHGWTIQTGSQGGWRSGPSKQKNLCDSAAVQCRQANKFSCSRPFFARKKEDAKFQQIVHVKYKHEDFIHLFM